MNKPFNHGYQWLFMDIHNSILDIYIYTLGQNGGDMSEFC